MTDTTEALVVPLDRVDRRKPRWHLTPGRRETLWGYVFISPWLFGLAVFTAGPMIASFILSLTNFDLIHPESIRFIGLDNYVRMTTDPNVAKVDPGDVRLRRRSRSR